MLDIREALLVRQRQNLCAHGNSLTHLAQLVAVEQCLQLRLTHEHDLNQLLRRSLQIGEHPNALQGLDGNILSFVNDQYDHAVISILCNQQLVQLTHHLRRLGANRLDS